MFHCYSCKERWLNTYRGGRVPELNRARIFQCEDCTEQSKQTQVNDGCRMLTKDNDMNPFVRFDHYKLPKLSEIEQMLIARIQTYMKVYKLQGGGTSYKGMCPFQIMFISFKLNFLTLLFPVCLSYY